MNDILKVGENITLLDHTFEEGSEKNEKWYKDREGTIGGSDIGSLFGENKYKSILQLFNEKSGRVKSEQVHNAATFLGNSMESDILSLYEYYNGDDKEMYPNHHNKINKVRDVITYNGYIRNSKYKGIQVELDGFFIDKDTNERVVVECKTMNGMAFKANNQEPPVKYLLQVLACMAVSEADRAVIIMLVDGINYHVFEVDRNESFISKIKSKVDSFWNNVNMFKETGSVEYVPEVDNTASCEKALQNLYPKAKDNFRKATEEEEHLINKYATMNEEYKELEEDLRAIRNKLKEGIKDGSKISCEGYSANWTNFGNTRRFQVRRVK